MGVDVNAEVMKAGELMSRYNVSREDQLTVVRLLIGAGVEHCLQAQERVRDERDALVNRAQGMVH